MSQHPHRLKLIVFTGLATAVMSCGEDSPTSVPDPEPGPVMAWTVMASGTDVTLRDVWGTSSTNVFAVGDDATILHYDGSEWTHMEVDETWGFYGIFGSSPTNVCAVGPTGGYLGA